MAVSATSLQAVMQQLQATATQASNQPLASAAPSTGNSFANQLKASIDKISGMQAAANAKGEAFERGDANIGINDVMVDMQKASVGFEMGVQVRNKLVAAYKDVMNMQV